MVGQSDMSGVQKGLHGWLVGYVWSAERALWLAGRIQCGVQIGLHGWPVGYVWSAEKSLW